MDILIDELQKWYSEQCDGDWEHEFGVKIVSLKNFSWDVTIDLEGTTLELRNFKEVSLFSNENNWIKCSVNKKQFKGLGGSQNLVEILRIFIEWTKEDDDKKIKKFIGLFF